MYLPRKPSKLPHYLYVVALLANIAAAVLNFITGKYLFGWIWTGCSLMWVVSVVLQIKAYRSRVATYELLRSTSRRWS